MLRIDIGCGANKKKDFIGLDVGGAPDIVCDISVERLPFDDFSVSYIYCSHCLEHIPRDRLGHVFSEIGRVAADGAVIEIWHPHMSHRDAVLIGHITCLSEEIYSHFGGPSRDLWRNFLNGRWILEEIRYGIEPQVIKDMEVAKVSMDFAISYFRDVIKEMGVFLRVDRSDAPHSVYYRRSYFAETEQRNTAFPLSQGPRQ